MGYAISLLYTHTSELPEAPIKKGTTNRQKTKGTKNSKKGLLRKRNLDRMKNKTSYNMRLKFKNQIITYL